MTPERSRRAVALVLTLLSVSLMLANHYYGHRSYLDRLNTDHTLYHPAAPWSQAEPAVPVLARRVWVLILDGLREDAADGLPTIGRLSVRGVRRTLRSEFPTFTYPNLTTMATGVPPFLSGVRLNEGRPGVPLDGVYDVARRAGLPAFVTTWSHFTEALDRENADFLVQQKMDLARLLSRAPTREMAWVHFEEIDEAGHRHGAASGEYAQAAQRGDALLGRMSEALDLEQDVLIALSDHGHRKRGGHGAIEPEVQAAFFLAVGAHVSRGVRLPERPMRDVAATVAALAGMAPPRDGLGVPMLDGFNLLPDRAARVLAPAFTQRAHSDAALGAEIVDQDRKLTETLSAGKAAAIVPALERLAERSTQREAKFTALMKQRQMRRLAWAALPLLFMAGVSIIAYRGGVLRPRPRDLIPILTYVLLFLGMYFTLGYALSWSVPRGAFSFTAETAAMGFLAAVPAVLVRRLAMVGRERNLEQASTVLLLWGLYILAVGAAGHDPAWLESPRVSFLLVFLSTIEFYAAGLLAVLAISTLLPRSLRKQA